MRALPNTPATPNERALAQWLRERFSNLSGVGDEVITLAQIPATTQFDDHGLELVFLDGKLLDPGVPAAPGTPAVTGDYSIQGKVLTIHAAVGVTDVIVIFYPYRTGV